MEKGRPLSKYGRAHVPESANGRAGLYRLTWKDNLIRKHFCAHFRLDPRVLITSINVIYFTFTNLANDFDTRRTTTTTTITALLAH